MSRDRFHPRGKKMPNEWRICCAIVQSPGSTQVLFSARQTVSPLADRLGLPIHIEPDLRERKLDDGPTVNDFFAAVKQTWCGPLYAHPGGESNAAAQRRGVAVVHRLLEQYSGEHLVLSTHGNLLALVLQYFDPRITYAFWKTLTMPDVYELQMESGEASMTRLWQSQG